MRVLSFHLQGFEGLYVRSSTSGACAGPESSRRGFVEFDSRVEPVPVANVTRNVFASQRNASSVSRGTNEVS